MSLNDLRMVILLTGIMSGFMSLVLYSLKCSYPKSIKGLGEWSAGLLVLFVATILSAGRNWLPDFFSNTFPIFLLLTGIYLNYVGTQRFFGVKPQIIAWMTLITGAFLASVWFTFVEPHYLLRMRFLIILIAVLYGVHAYLVLKQGTVLLAKVLTLIAFSGMSLIILARLIGSFIYPIGDEVLSIDLRQLVFITSFSFSIFLSSTSMVLMASGRLHKELQYLSTHDSLTNALTRRSINEVCLNELERSRRHNRSMALLMIDIDHFKAVNDSYGHQVGDLLLVNFVNEIKALLRQHDQLGRYGGEEFLALLPETSMEEAVVVAERIREACAHSIQPPACTVSIGISTNQKDNDTMDTLLSRADAAMYRAKKHGRNRVETS